MKELEIEIGTEGVVSLYHDGKLAFTSQAKVVVIYRNYLNHQKFSVLLNSDCEKNQSIVTDFDEFGLIQSNGNILFKFEVKNEPA